MDTMLEDLITVSPPVWSGKQLDVQPGDLSIIAPLGSGIQGLFPIRPWDNPLSQNYQDPGKYYAYQSRVNHHFLDAPITDAAGGTVYFDGQPGEDDVRTILRLLEVRLSVNEYAVFLGHATHPREERYLTQLRIVSRFALKNMFAALTEEEYVSFPPQNLSVGELVWKFIEHQQQTWGTYNTYELSGVMGGDGDWAKEALAFGFMVENAYQGVYRIWSRAWLVTT